LLKMVALTTPAMAIRPVKLIIQISVFVMMKTLPLGQAIALG